jgi:hypothetical protein
MWSVKVALFVLLSVGCNYKSGIGLTCMYMHGGLIIRALCAIKIMEGSLSHARKN